MAKNQLAKDIKFLKRQVFMAGVQATLDIMTVALNDEFGFGRDRLKRLELRFCKLMEEYGGMCYDSVNYGNKKLKNIIVEIMKEDKNE